MKKDRLRTLHGTTKPMIPALRQCILIMMIFTFTMVDSKRTKEQKPYEFDGMEQSVRRPIPYLLRGKSTVRDGLERNLKNYALK